jgi:hypothetical protein
MPPSTPPSTPLPPSALNGIVFTASIIRPPSQLNIFLGTKIIPLQGLSLGYNSVQITDADANILKALTNLANGEKIISSLTCSYGNELPGIEYIVGGTSSYPPPPPPPTTEEIISVKRGGKILDYPTIEVKFSTANGRIPGTGTATQILFTLADGLNIVTSAFALVADPGNTSLRNFFTATILDTFSLPNVLASVAVLNDYNVCSTINNVTL